ncbi:MAG: hypothetical protein J0I99_19790 [Devosia sp.]|uniref:hypothetical protein n=1 Tax=Devosia sp. TaxID=1871048 RepID=UPI001AC42925|nr:hypothetical protein [Devosia sp.]MBN9317989.1 hypothetical protein [Devosia sp.]
MSFSISLPTAPAADDLVTATAWVEGLERRFAANLGLNKADAWKAIADGDKHLTVGAVEGISRKRVKDVSTRIFRALQNVVIRELTKEMKGLESELEVARRAGLRMDPSTIAEAEAALQHARQVLGATH